MNDKILKELKEIKSILLFQSLAAGITPKGLARLIKVSEKRIRNQFPLGEIKR
jgi:hypothetical protein